MTKQKNFSKKAKRRFKSGLKHIHNFYGWFDPKLSQSMLWDQFHYSMISEDRGDMSPEDRKEAFFFYESLKQLLQGTALIEGL